MKCPRCGAENAPGSQFCGECGAKLSEGNPVPPPTFGTANQQQVATQGPEPARPEYQLPVNQPPTYPAPGSTPPANQAAVYSAPVSTQPVGPAPVTSQPAYPPAAARKSNTRTIIFIIAGAALLLCIGCVAFFAIIGTNVFNATQPAVTAGDAFMTALKNKSYEEAYGLCGESLQQELGNADKLRSTIVDGNVQPVSWSYSSRNISGDEAQLDGDVTFTENRQGTLRLVLAKEGNDWKITGFHMQEK